MSFSSSCSSSADADGGITNVNYKLAFLLLGLALGFFVLPMLQGMFLTAPTDA